MVYHGMGSLQTVPEWVPITNKAFVGTAVLVGAYVAYRLTKAVVAAGVTAAAVYLVWKYNAEIRQKLYEATR